MDHPAPSRLRLVFAVGAAIAATVALVFATLGDGVSTPADADGVEAVLLDQGHALTWFILAVALGIATWQRRWTAWAGRIAGVALVLYLAFVVALVRAG